MQATISVLMACFNTENSVERSINSILNQSYEDFEFIIVDDASTDHTPEILQKIAIRDHRIKILTNSTNRGLSYSINRAFERSVGTYLVRMDADDVAHSQRFARQLKYFNANGELCVLGTGANYVNQDEIGSDQTVLMPESHADIMKFMFKSSPFIHPTVMMRRSFFEITGGYDENLMRAQDYDLWLRGREIGHYHNVPEVLLNYTYDNARSHKAVWQTFVLKIKAKPNLTEFARAVAYSLYELFCLIIRLTKDLLNRN